MYLLNKMWRVLAIDEQPLSLETLQTRVPENQLNRLEVSLSNFSDMILPDNIDLINASYSLPFCTPEDFSKHWQMIIDHLAIGGRFAGQLFGDRDEWAEDPTRTFHTQDEMLDLFKDNFVIEYLENVEEDLPKADGIVKRWHLYHIVARKIK